MRAVALPSLLARLAGILLAGVLGAVAGWMMARAFGLSGLAAAVLALPIGMTVATGAFAGWVMLLQALARR